MRSVHFFPLFGSVHTGIAAAIQQGDLRDVILFAAATKQGPTLGDRLELTRVIV